MEKGEIWDRVSERDAARDAEAFDSMLADSLNHPETEGSLPLYAQWSPAQSVCSVRVRLDPPVNMAVRPMVRTMKDSAKGQGPRKVPYAVSVMQGLSCRCAQSRAAGGRSARGVQSSRPTSCWSAANISRRMRPGLCLWETRHQDALWSLSAPKPSGGLISACTAPPCLLYTPDAAD